MTLLESGEMYLETILILSQKKPYVRAIDVGEHIGYSRPSVSRAVGLLKGDGYILVDEDGHITLTETGRKVAETIYERHTLFTELLEALGVDGETASADACKIEHHISDASFQAIKAYLRTPPAERQALQVHLPAENA